jgi:hypothetical protein
LDNFLIDAKFKEQLLKLKRPTNWEQISKASTLAGGITINGL